LLSTWRGAWLVKRRSFFGLSSKILAVFDSIFLPRKAARSHQMPFKNIGFAGSGT